MSSWGGSSEATTTTTGEANRRHRPSPPPHHGVVHHGRDARHVHRRRRIDGGREHGFAKTVLTRGRRRIVRLHLPCQHAWGHTHGVCSRRQAAVLGKQGLAEVEVHARPKLLRRGGAQQQERLPPRLLRDGLQGWAAGCGLVGCGLAVVDCGLPLGTHMRSSRLNWATVRGPPGSSRAPPAPPCRVSTAHQQTFGLGS